MTVAIDFTASNGIYTDEESLHYLDDNNQYEKSIMAIESILEAFDNYRCFPVYGFGGIPQFMGASQTSHCFPLNGNSSSPEVYGINGIINAYRESLPKISFSAPTLFSNVLNQVIQHINSKLKE